MRILGVDPGPEESAFLLLGVNVIQEQILAHGKLPNKQCMEQMLALTPVDFCVIEMVACYGMAVGQEVFETVWWAGRFAEAWDEHCLTKQAPAARLFRQDVKLNLCHDTRAKDTNIRQALIDRFGKQGTKKAPGPTFGISGDEWSALAIAATWSDLSSMGG